MDAWLALSIGAMGSLHCIGMCGPINLLIPLNRASHASILTGLLTFHSGRLLTYAILGGLFGWIGRSLFVGPYQQYASILLGVFIVLGVLFSFKFLNKYTYLAYSNSLINSAIKKVKSMQNKQPHLARLSLGIVNGFLPCGLVYLAIAYAIASGSLIHGTITMTLFGLGTLPTLLATSLLGLRLGKLPAIASKRLIPAFTFFLGLFFIYRGLNLNLPFSPELNFMEAIIAVCF